MSFSWKGIYQSLHVKGKDQQQDWKVEHSKEGQSLDYNPDNLSLTAWLLAVLGWGGGSGSPLGRHLERTLGIKPQSMSLLSTCYLCTGILVWKFSMQRHSSCKKQCWVQLRRAAAGRGPSRRSRSFHWTWKLANFLPPDSHRKGMDRLGTQGRNKWVVGLLPSQGISGSCPNRMNGPIKVEQPSGKSEWHSNT